MPSAISAPPKDVSRGVLRILATSGLLAATLISAATYFWALSQYSTDDQTKTAKRLEAFVASARSIQLRDGSLVSDLLIAYPAKWLKGVLGHFYQLNDPIVWDIHYTSVLPFALIQVIVALAFMAYLIALLIRLVSPSRWWTNAFLLASLIVMNLPMLKGLAKVLKYDILSTLFAAIAILHYIGYRTLGRSGVAVIAVFCALAYLEKDTTLSITLLIWWVELMLIPFLVPAPRAAVKAAARFTLAFASIFLATCGLLVPKIWRDPRKMLGLFDVDGVPTYFVNIRPSLAVILVIVLSLAYFAMPQARRSWPALVPTKVPASAVTAFFLIVSLTIVALGASAIFVQSNILFDPTIAGNDIDVAALRAQSIYVARPIADAAITTMDHSALLQHLKMFWSMVRAIFYTLPEITLLVIVGAAPSFLLVTQANPSGRKRHAGPLVLLLLFPIGMLVAFSLADLPFDPKYLVLVSVLLTIYGVYSLLLSLDHVGVLVSATVQLAIAVLMVMVALSAAPSYLRYKNILRDRAQETAAALDMNHYIWWTWPGWGETAYPISRYIERSHAGPVTVAFDYLEPFYKPPGQRWVKADFYKCQSTEELARSLEELRAQSVDLLIVSKNKSNRQWCLNKILLRMRDKAVFVDRQQGIEYGWLFRFSDVLETFRQ